MVMGIDGLIEVGDWTTLLAHRISITNWLTDWLSVRPANCEALVS